MFSKMEAESKTRRGQKERERQEELQAQVCVCVCVCVLCVCIPVCVDGVLLSFQITERREGQREAQLRYERELEEHRWGLY